MVSLSACAAGPLAPATTDQAPQLKAVALAPGQKLRVVATTSIVGDVVRQVGGDRIDLTTLMGIGVDPHTYVATPSGTAAVHDAHLLVSSGAGLEEGLSKILQGASGTAIEVQLSDGLQLAPAPQGSGAQQADRGTAGGELDPHVWFDVQNVLQWVQTIRDTLSSLDPANSALYQANADAYATQLRALDDWILEQVASIPQDRRKLVTNHLALGYFGLRYGFEQVGAIYPLSPSSEPSAQDVAALEEAIREYGLPVIFTESTVSPKLADQVARDTGVKLIPLYTESLGGPGTGAESYVDMMRYDVQAIVAGLR
jgi:ABC-type Zn uptake system ZnuABC Zn-binding protein ZnuA